MEANFTRALPLVLKHEGGFVNHPLDPGGATNRGITLATYRRFRKRDVTVDELKAISEEEVAQIYRRLYWDVVRGDDLPPGLDYAVFDFAVNSGTGRAARVLQRIVGARQDGAIGPATLSAIRAGQPEQLIERLCDDRLAFLQGLRTWPVFGKGWGRRVEEVRRDALAMARSGLSAAKQAEPSAEPAEADPLAGATGPADPSEPAASVASSASVAPCEPSPVPAAPEQAPAPAGPAASHPITRAGAIAAVAAGSAGALTYFWNQILALFGD